MVTEVLSFRELKQKRVISLCFLCICLKLKFARTLSVLERNAKKECGKKNWISGLGELGNKLSPISPCHHTFYEKVWFFIFLKLSNCYYHYYYFIFYFLFFKFFFAAFVNNIANETRRIKMRSKQQGIGM